MSITAKDIMQTEVITFTPSTRLREFARILAEDRISGAPVVRVDGALVGIVSRTDLVTRLLEDDTTFGTSEDEALSFESNIRQVGDIMQSEVLTVGPDAPLPEIATRMAADRVHRVVVMDGDQVAGIITSLDLLKAFVS
ncbi:MAG: CBS domain-containing protein [Planctomycetota bacterium]|jgi:CBS domain-containing protein